MSARSHHSKKPRDVPDAKGEVAVRRWFAEQYLATITADIGEIGQLTRLEHHLRSFLARVIEWERMPTYGD